MPKLIFFDYLKVNEGPKLNSRILKSHSKQAVEFEICVLIVEFCLSCLKLHKKHLGLCFMAINIRYIIFLGKKSFWM